MFQDPSSVLSALFSSDLEDIPKGKNAFSTLTCPRWPDFRPHNTNSSEKNASGQWENWPPREPYYSAFTLAQTSQKHKQIDVTWLNKLNKSATGESFNWRVLIKSLITWLLKITQQFQPNNKVDFGFISGKVTFSQAAAYFLAGPAEYSWQDLAAMSSSFFLSGSL